jgi:hypothetical protein
LNIHRGQRGRFANRPYDAMMAMNVFNAGIAGDDGDDSLCSLRGVCNTP